MRILATIGLLATLLTGQQPKDDDLRAAPIAEAWIAAGSSATADELVHALGSERWYVVKRAAAEIVQRGIPSVAAVQAVVAVRGRVFDHVVIEQGREWEQRGYGHSSITMTVRSEAVQAAFALLLLAAGDERWSTPQAVAACAEVFAIAPETVVAELETRRAAGRLGELAIKLDADLVHPSIRMSQPR